MNTHPHEILVLYDASSSKAKQTLAYAHTLSNHVREYEYHKNPLSSTMWKRILFRLDIEPKKLFDKSLPEYQKEIRGRAFDDEGWLNVIRRNTHLIKAPIVVMGKKAILCTNPTQIFSLLQQVSSSIELDGIEEEI